MANNTSSNERNHPTSADYADHFLEDVNDWVGIHANFISIQKDFEKQQLYSFFSNEGAGKFAFMLFMSLECLVKALASRFLYSDLSGTELIYKLQTHNLRQLIGKLRKAQNVQTGDFPAILEELEKHLALFPIINERKKNGKIVQTNLVGVNARYRLDMSMLLRGGQIPKKLLDMEGQIELREQIQKLRDRTRSIKGIGDTLEKRIDDLGFPEDSKYPAKN